MQIEFWHTVAVDVIDQARFCCNTSILPAFCMQAYLALHGVLNFYLGVAAL